MRNAAIIAAAFSIGFCVPAIAGEVSGTVYDQRGMPVAGVAVSVDGQQVLTGADGTYRLAGVAAGQQVVSANGQRVGIEIAAEGEVIRNIFLLSQRARAEVTGVPEQVEAAEDAFADALELAEQMLESGPATTEITWRWNDLDA